MSVYEMAVQYYPRLWDEGRIQALVAAGKLTAEQAKQIMAQEN